MRPCLHNPPKPGTCSYCRWIAHPETREASFQEHWLEPVTRKRPGQCIHLGAATGETVECPSCPRGKVMLKLFACAVHGQCTQGKAVPGVACCKGCPDRTVIG